ncbi:MAG TPA: cytochrome c peroxidase [Chitinophagales bacterium]|nr:cytochrome c peroxidase [Chitinophagales bacterium]
MRKPASIFWGLLLLITAILQSCHNGAHEKESDYKGTKYNLPVTNLLGKPRAPYADSLTVEGIELGRRLFYDVHLSKDGKKSCFSCHRLEYAFSDPGVALSMNETGMTTRNAQPLQNLAWLTAYFWDGRSSTLQQQAQDAFAHELALDTVKAVKYVEGDTTDMCLYKKAFGRPGVVTATKLNLAMEEFLLSAVSCNSRFDSVMRGQAKFTQEEADGYNKVFSLRTGDCIQCHRSIGRTFLFTDSRFHNNGLDKVDNIKDFKDAGRGSITHNESDYGLFRTPSLRNVAVSAPYMHDGRFKTLRKVIDFYSDSLHYSPTVDPNIVIHLSPEKRADQHSNGGMHLTEKEKEELLSFLNTLTDTSFLHNPALQNPF